jgi:hypothetical protein
LAQSIHAATTFAHELPQFFKSWIQNSNYVVALATQDEQSLQNIYEKLRERGAPVIAFREPDIGDELTAISFYGLPHYRRIVSNLPLALKSISGTEDKATECTVGCGVQGV